jgi:hypothetical protein
MGCLPLTRAGCVCWFLARAGQLLLVLDRNVENYNRMRDECETELNRCARLTDHTHA